MSFAGGANTHKSCIPVATIVCDTDHPGKAPTHESTRPGKEPTYKTTRPGKEPTHKKTRFGKAPPIRSHNPRDALPPTTDLLTVPMHENRAWVTGVTTDKLRIHNSKRIAQQMQQHPCSYWRTHEGTFELPPSRPRATSYCNEMSPANLALYHPAADLLLEYATKGCPTHTEKRWSIDKMEAAITRGPHPSAMQPDTLAQLRRETFEKVRKGQARIVSWDSIKNDPLKDLKISPKKYSGNLFH